jgi:hypothetical protein
MEQINYEAIGRLVEALAQLRNKADESHLLWVNNAFDGYGVFNLVIYDDKVDTSFYNLQYLKPLEKPEDIAVCMEQIKYAEGFIDGFIACDKYIKEQAEKAAKEAEQKAKEEADRVAAEFVGSMNGEAIENEQEF